MPRFEPCILVDLDDILHEGEKEILVVLSESKKMVRLPDATKLNALSGRLFVPIKVCLNRLDI